MLTHAVEAYTCVDFDKLAVPADEPFPYEGKNPLGDCLAERAIQLIGEHLATAVREPRNLAAREGMSLAATLGGLAFSNCAVAAVHALEYPLGGTVHCSHGAGNGLLLPHVMRFNLPARPREFARIAQLLGEQTDGLTETQAAERAVAAVETLRDAICIPVRIRDLGGRREQLPEFAKKAFGIKRLMLLNGRPASEADLLGILEAAYRRRAGQAEVPTPPFYFFRLYVVMAEEIPEFRSGILLEAIPFSPGSPPMSGPVIFNDVQVASGTGDCRSMCRFSPSQGETS